MDASGPSGRHRFGAERCCLLFGRLNFQAGSRLAIAGTIQFAASLQLAREQLAEAFPALAVPQAKPLSPGPLAGPTTPAQELFCATPCVRRNG